MGERTLAVGEVLFVYSQLYRRIDGKVELKYLPARHMNESNAVGFFYVKLAHELITPGKPMTFSVASEGQDSNRWFTLNPYREIVP